MSQLKSLTKGVVPELIVLEPGVHLLGRDTDCGIHIDHVSISTVHCEISVDGSKVTVRDLGSTNGTFVDDKPVRETELRAGQILRTGLVDWKFVSSTLRVGKETAGTPSTAAVPEPAPVLSPKLNLNKPAAPEIPPEQQAPLAKRPCYKHPYVEAAYKCRRCETEFCPQCIRQREILSNTRHDCPLCSARCMTIADFEGEERKQAERLERRRNLFQCPRDIFQFPFNRDGVILLVGGSLAWGAVKLLLGWAKYAGPFGIGAYILLPLISTGYMAAYFRKIVQATADGDDAMPDWPDFSAWWDDIGRPTCYFLGVLLLSFGPLVGYVFSQGEDALWWVRGLLTGWGLLYFPMAALAVAMADTIVAANPWTVLVSIARVGKNYIMACLVFWGAYFLIWTVSGWMDGLEVGELSLLSFVVGAVTIPISLYAIIIEARILGLIYHGSAERLGWFPEDAKRR